MLGFVLVWTVGLTPVPYVPLRRKIIHFLRNKEALQSFSESPRKSSFRNPKSGASANFATPASGVLPPSLLDPLLGGCKRNPDFAAA